MARQRPTKKSFGRVAAAKSVPKSNLNRHSSMSSMTSKEVQRRLQRAPGSTREARAVQRLSRIHAGLRALAEQHECQEMQLEVVKQGVLNDIDTDPEGQVMMVEQFIAEARSCLGMKLPRFQPRPQDAQAESARQAFRYPSLISASWDLSRTCCAL